jgi:opacity protein-like surface antigen
MNLSFLGALSGVVGTKGTVRRPDVGFGLASLRYGWMLNDPAQTLLGSDWNFALGSSIGVRWMLSPSCALTTAFEYRHFSNAGTSDPNRGYNGLGGMIGVSWFY